MNTGECQVFPSTRLAILVDHVSKIDKSEKCTNHITIGPTSGTARYPAEYQARWNIEYSIIFHMVQVHEVNVTVNNKLQRFSGFWKVE